MKCGYQSVEANEVSRVKNRTFNPGFSHLRAFPKLKNIYYMYSVCDIEIF